MLRSGTLPDSGGAETTILVTIDYRDLLQRYWNTATIDKAAGNTSAAAGYGVISYGTLIPVDELLRRAADAKIIPIVLTDSGGIMSYGLDGRRPPARRNQHNPSDQTGLEAAGGGSGRSA